MQHPSWKTGSELTPCLCNLLNLSVGDDLLTYLLPLSVRDPSLTLTQFCARLKTVLFCRAYETLAYRLHDSSGCKDCCADTNWLTYLLTYCGLLQESRQNVWKKDEDYVRMDGSTGAQSRKRFTTNFNDVNNERWTDAIALLLLSSFVLYPSRVLLIICMSMSVSILDLYSA